MGNKIINVPVQANHLHKPTFLLLIFILGLFPCSNLGFELEFYALSCPGVEFVVRDVVRSASSSDPSIPGKLLRLLFHDCFVDVSFPCLCIDSFYFLRLFNLQHIGTERGC